MRTSSPTFAVCLLGIALTCGAIAETAPAVSNRPARIGEIGYKPADGSISQLNPPSFIWLHEQEAHRYQIEWSQDGSFPPGKTFTQADLPFNSYTHNRPMQPGKWFWRYRYKTANGQQSAWSRTREVSIAENAVDFPMPSRAEQRAKIPDGHPRLFFRPDDLPRLRAAASHERKAQFDALKKQADAIIAAGPTPEPQQLGSARNPADPELAKHWLPNRDQTNRACAEAEILAFVALLSEEPAYREAARKWVLHLASWNPDGPTGLYWNSEAGKSMLHRMARAYDWAYDTLSNAEQRQVREVLRIRAQEAWESGEVRRGTGHLNSPFDSHANRTWHMLGETAIATLGELPQAQTWLDYSLHKFYAAYPVWADDDGGWHEGVHYWGGYMGHIAPWLHAAKVALGIDASRKPFFAHVGDFALYVNPPGSPNAGFGDLSHRADYPEWGSFMAYFTRMGGATAAHAPYWQWWSQQWAMRPPKGVLGFVYDVMLPEAPLAKAPADLPPSKVFHGIGVASLHSNLADTSDDVHLLFKSSPFGTQSHGHNPQNSFQLNAYGEALLTTCVYRDFYGSPFHFQWAHSTQAQNALLVNGEGQTTRKASATGGASVTGKIIHSELGADFDYLIGDATSAYGDRLTKYLRHVVFVKPGFIILVDEIAAATASTFELMLHAERPFTIDEDNGTLSLEGEKAQAAIRYLGEGTSPLSLKQWSGYNPPPAYGKTYPEQWHVRAATSEPMQTASIITVICVSRSGEQTQWSAARLQSADAIGVQITIPGEQGIWIGINQNTPAADGEPAPARLDGRVINGRILLERTPPSPSTGSGNTNTPHFIPTLEHHNKPTPKRLNKHLP